MSTYDPRTLIQAFTALQEQIKRFSQTASDTLKQAEYTQNCAHERVNQALRWSAITSSQVKSDLEDVQEIETEVNSLLSHCRTAVDIAHQTMTTVKRVQQQAEATLNRWQAELQSALVWQARAEKRLEIAIQTSQIAKGTFEYAQTDLEQAKARLESCTKDPERKHCNSEQRTYNSAKVTILQAVEKLKVAEIEVNAAQQDLGMAGVKVRCSHRAVEYAEEAVQHAYVAMERSEYALNHAERSSENAESANRAITTAQLKVVEADEQAEQAAIKVHQAVTNTNEACVHTQAARNMSDLAYRLAIIGTQELRYRTNDLIRLNQISSDH